MRLFSKLGFLTRDCAPRGSEAEVAKAASPIHAGKRRCIWFIRILGLLETTLLPYPRIRRTAHCRTEMGSKCLLLRPIGMVKTSSGFEEKPRSGCEMLSGFFLAALTSLSGNANSEEQFSRVGFEPDLKSQPPFNISSDRSSWCPLHEVGRTFHDTGRDGRALRLDQK